MILLSRKFLRRRKITLCFQKLIELKMGYSAFLHQGKRLLYDMIVTQLGFSIAVIWVSLCCLFFEVHLNPQLPVSTKSKFLHKKILSVIISLHIEHSAWNRTGNNNNNNNKNLVLNINLQKYYGKESAQSQISLCGQLMLEVTLINR